MVIIPKSVVKRIPYVGPVFSEIKLVMNVKEIIDTKTFIEAAKLITRRFVNECTPPELLIAGKCVMLTGGIIATVASGSNLLIISGTVSTVRSIIQN